MGQIATTVPPKGLGRLQLNDFFKGALITCFGHLVAMVIFLIRQDHFPTWPEWQPYVEVTVYTFLVYLGKNLGTNNVGELFTKDKPVVHVDANDLKELEAKAENG